MPKKISKLSQVTQCVAGIAIEVFYAVLLAAVAFAISALVLRWS